MKTTTMPERVEVDIVRELDVARTGHLDEAQASSEDGIGLNLAYFDTRGWDVQDAALKHDEESALLERLASAGWTGEEVDQIIEEHFSDWTELAGFDAGMGAAVLALSAAGATPISSCNGGTIGSDHHMSDVPHILFAGSDDIDAVAIQSALAEADLGAIVNGGYGEIYADQVLKFHRFAGLLIQQLLSKTASSMA